jgi:GT2 family glycosyltransferase
MAKGKYILLLNNDTIVQPDFLVELVKKISSSPDIAGVQSKLLLMDDHSRLDAVGAFLTPTGFLFHWGFGKKDSIKYDRFFAKGAQGCFGGISEAMKWTTSIPILPILPILKPTLSRTADRQ